MKKLVTIVVGDVKQSDKRLDNIYARFNLASGFIIKGNAPVSSRLLLFYFNEIKNQRKKMEENVIPQGKTPIPWLYTA